MVENLSLEFLLDLVFNGCVCLYIIHIAYCLTSQQKLKQPEAEG